MASRLHSSNTLVDGMEGVTYGDQQQDRKRELEDKIKVAGCSARA